MNVKRITLLLFFIFALDFLGASKFAIPATDKDLPGEGPTRRPQLQCRDYALAGPWKDLKKYKPQEWNEIVAIVKDGVAHCTCNGEVLNSEFKVLVSGPIGLEGDRGQMEYWCIRLKELE